MSGDRSCIHADDGVVCIYGRTESCATKVPGTADDGARLVPALQRLRDIDLVLDDTLRVVVAGCNTAEHSGARWAGLGRAKLGVGWDGIGLNAIIEDSRDGI